MDINMTVNSSSCADITVTTNSSRHRLLICFSYKISIYILSAFSITYIFLLPVLMFVLYLGYQQWKNQRSASTAPSHSDVITYHSIIMQLNEFLGFFFFFCGGYIHRLEIFLVGINILSMSSCGKALFHLLTCVERYLAVVHPITYLGLRQAGGVRIRDISIGCVWLLSFGYMTLAYLVTYESYMIMYFCVLVFMFIVVSLSSIWVLCTLKRPGPGQVGGNREHVNQSKQRAFHTIMAIMGVLLFRFGANLIGNAICYSEVLFQCNYCYVFSSALWCDVPSGLVLPLLFLHRAGKLTCRKQNTESGSG